MSQPSTSGLPKLDWVLVANASRARCFERDPENGALREIADFAHPASRMPAHELADDRPGHAFKGAASTAFDPDTDPRTKEHAAFARELAAFLDDAALGHRYERLAVVASNPFLGLLRAELRGAAALLQASAPVDLTTYTDGELERRVSAALADSGHAR
jgi:protein required for attachment to host cells